ncbi:YihY/virulence factor BrkB family protein [Salinicoccus sp. ID82-1]|uniref:YihY/virulence factor BrkB family protein n=1 Tax=Salinicoccus sp. ID82-1 TaxID=2820269 RepID=UPI001F18F4E0|nr:YihY/virulence factor BrkB family protein [Salinicoccus sp. ID82-1]MCG1010948.1 YihY/virulence factor BrkB family protein [Salinicoccus sp. ID82-1]
MADKPTNSDYLNQAKQEGKEKDAKKAKGSNGEVFVDNVKFKSKSAKKPNETLYVSKINKPAKHKDDSNFFQRLMFQFGKDDTSGMAAQLAYYFLLAIFPLLIFLLTLVPLFQIDQATITQFIQDYAPAQIAGTLEGIINDVMGGSSGGLLSVGLLFTLWSASNGMTALMNAFNVAYDIEDDRNFVVAKLWSLLFTIILALSILLTFVLIVFGEQIGNLLFGAIGLDQQFQFVWNLVRSLLPVLLVFIVFLVIYTTAPNIKLQIKAVIPGAIFTTIAFLLASWAFSFYISNFSNYNATYGSIAGVIILILWLYITGVIIILGAQINAIMHKRAMEKEGEETPENESTA